MSLQPVMIYEVENGFIFSTMERVAGEWIEGDTYVALTDKDLNELVTAWVRDAL